MRTDITLRCGVKYTGNFQETVRQINSCMSMLMEKVGEMGFQPNSVTIFSKSSTIWMEVGFNVSTEKWICKTEIVSQPANSHMLQEYMNGVSCETDYDEVTRSNELKWRGHLLGVVIVKHRYQHR